MGFAASGNPRSSARPARSLFLLLAVTLLHAAPVANDSGRRWTSFAYPPVFEHISVEQGLSQSIVHWIEQDHRGFLWFGTDSGLNRYDGYDFQVFRHDKQNPKGSIGGDRVHCLLEDRRHFLWIATNKGLSRLDPETLEIETYEPSGEPGALPSTAILRLIEDKEGNLWIGTEANGLCVLPHDWKPGSPPHFQVLANPGRDPKGFPTGRILSLHMDHRGVLWFGSVDMGLGRIFPKAGGGAPRIEYFPADPGNPDTSPSSTIYAIEEDALGDLWIGSSDGLYLLDPDRGLCRRFVHVAGDDTTMPNNLVYSLNLDRSGTLWVSNDGGGLSKMLPRRHSSDRPRFQCFQHDPRNPWSLNSNGTQFVFEDRSGVLWVSAFQAGLNKLVMNPLRTSDRGKPALIQCRNSPADPFSLSGNLVAAICEDRFGSLWVGTDGSGVNRAVFAGRNMSFERFRAVPGHAGALQDDVILSIHLDAGKRLWLGTYKGGLIRVDQDSPTAAPRFTHFRHDPGNPGTLSSDWIRDILDDGKGKLWIATGNRGLDLFDPGTGRVKRYVLGKDGRPWMRSSPEILRLARDSYGTIWMATPDGLNRLNPVTGECRDYVPGGPGTLNDAYILTVHVDRAGNLWAGTGGSGLNKAVIPPWDGPEPHFVQYGLQEGLPELDVKSILEDEGGQLWLSTNHNLCRFDPLAGRGYPFPWHNEMRRSEYIKNSCFRSSSGELLFGSNDGFSLFHPDDIAFNTIIPPVVLTQFQILNKTVPLKGRMLWDPDGTAELTVHPGESTFGIFFSALHFVAPMKNQYAYQMEGIDPSWNEVGNQHSVSYAKVPPGHYLLRVRGSNCDGIRSHQELRLRIRVLPSWYQTWWFKTLFFGIVSGGIVAGIWWYMANLRRRNHYLEQAMAEQSRKLREGEALNALAHLTETAGTASEDLKHWVSEMAQEISGAVNACQVDVWEVSGDSFTPVTETKELPPISHHELSCLQVANPSDEESDVFPVPGPDGDVHAALRVFGKQSPWTTLERQLLASFIHHLGGAYHLKELRLTLAEAKQQRSLDRQKLLAQGSGVLQLCPSCHRCFDEGMETCPEDDSRLTSPRLLPFRFQGRYRLQRLLGEGATAQVFEAWDEKLDRDVALKAIKPRNFILEQTRERFTREARILARLDHPGIVSVYDSGELEDGTLFLVMERLHGTTVGHMLRCYGPARPGQAAFLLRQVASALGSTHTKGLIHRDLKPENIFAVTGSDWLRYKVLDFGLAKTQVADTDLTQSGTLMGTPNYMSPEQAHGKSVDWRSDLYSLAAILYEILSGKGVVESRVLAEVFVEVISRTPAPLTTLIRDCPLEVDALIHQGLAKEPRQRPMDLLAWASRLDGALQTWNRDIPGWPDHFEPDHGHVPVPAEAPPTL